MKRRPCPPHFAAAAEANRRRAAAMKAALQAATSVFDWAEVEAQRREQSKRRPRGRPRSPKRPVPPGLPEVFDALLQRVKDLRHFQQPEDFAEVAKYTGRAWSGEAVRAIWTSQHWEPLDFVTELVRRKLWISRREAQEIVRRLNSAR